MCMYLDDLNVLMGSLVMQVKMRGRGRPRRDFQSITDPPSNPTREEGESSRSGEYKALMQFIQVLYASVQALVAQ